MYHNVEDLRGEPHAVAIRGEDDVHVTEGVYKRPLFLQPTYRYRGPVLHRTPGCWASASPAAGGAELNTGVEGCPGMWPA